MATCVSKAIVLAELLSIELQGEQVMAMIKGSERDNSDTATAGAESGVPVAVEGAKSDNSGKFGMTNFKSAISTVACKVKETADAAAEHGKQLMKSKQQKDAEAVERLANEFGECDAHSLSESEKSCARFKSALDSTIDVKYAEIMSGKANADMFLTFVDSQILTASVRNVFKNALDAVPAQIEAACKLSEAILAPSALEREQLIKSAVGIGGGAAGIGMIIAGVGGALGWGAGIIASVSVFFVGTSLAGPAGWAIAGITLAGIAAYFATTSNKATDTERFLKVLKCSTSRAVDAIWAEYETSLVKVMGSETAS